MALSGSSNQGPRACPFIALELDRDRRSESPDYRHRCYAEPTPAPRSIAHQEAYCLSPNFAACPIFQDWATRAAAEPIASPMAAAADSAAADQPAAFEPLPADAELPPAAAEPPAAPDSMADGVGFAALQEPFDDDAPAQQLGAFDAPAMGSFFAPPDVADEEQSSAPPAPPPDFVPPPRDRQPDYERQEYERQEYERQSEPASEDEPAVPAFLAGRSPRPQSTALPPPRPSQQITRDEIVPSWDIDGRYGAEAAPDDDGDRLGGLLTALAVVIILALGIAGVIFLPGLLAGGPSRTPAPSFSVPSARPSSVASLPATIGPSSAPSVAPTEALPTPTQGPQASPRTYRIKPGDSLARIANRFGITVADILAANPQITDPNHIEVGQQIVIPAAPES